MSKDELHKDILKEARERWEACDNHYSEMYEDQEEDWKFLHGVGQWDTGSIDSRNKDGRPSLVLNQMLPYAHQITNDIKQARLAIRVVPIDSEADIDTADIRAGVIRNIEKQSKAKNIYGTAAMNAIGSGLGWIRVKVDYADNDTFDQEAFLERVIDPTSIYLDPLDMSMDGADADYGFVTEGLSYTPERFEELYPDAAQVSFFGLVEGSDEETINLVEYYYKEKKKVTLHEIEITHEIMTELGIVFEKEMRQVRADELKTLDEFDTVYEKKRSREIEDVVVYHCVLSGDDVLSREIFPCHYIPLVPVIGEEFFVDGKREFHSLIRQAKDAQRMYNYWKSASTEFIAMQPKAPWVGPVGSFQSYPDKWANANTQNFAYLEYDVVNDEETGQPFPPPQRTPPITGSPAMMQEAVAARDDIRLSLGIPQSNMGERSNAVSGIAIRNQQIEGDNATFHFIDNLSSSISQVGRILNDIIPQIYSDRKVMRIIGEDGEEENVPVNVPFVKEEGEIRPARDGDTPTGTYDLSVGKYDIDMDVGASYSSRRQETADKLIEAMAIKPELIEVTGDLLFEALDVPMAKQIAERIKTTMDPSVLGDDPQAAQLQQAAQTLEQMNEKILNYEAALEDKSKNEQFDQASKAEEMQLERDKFEVDSEKTKADIQKIYADIQNTNAETAGQSSQNIDAIVNDVNDLRLTVELLLDDVEEDNAEEIEEGIPSDNLVPPIPEEMGATQIESGQ